MVSTLLPEPMRAELTVSPTAATSGFTTPTEPWSPRELNDDNVSVIAGVMSLIVPVSAPSKVTSRVPASAAGRSLSVPAFGTWKTGISLSPVIPAPKTSRLEVKIEPIAPAAFTLPDRPTEPQRRVASLSSHSSQATLPATNAASSTESGSQPSALSPGIVTTDH